MGGYVMLPSNTVNALLHTSSRYRNEQMNNSIALICPTDSTVMCIPSSSWNKSTDDTGLNLLCFVPVPLIAFAERLTRWLRVNLIIGIKSDVTCIVLSLNLRSFA